MGKAKLDPRKSRKLTSRECASILGAYLGGMATSNLVGPKEARKGLEVWLEDGEGWEWIRHQAARGTAPTADSVELARKHQGTGSDPALRTYWRGLGALISGLRTLASEKTVKTAVQWNAERDDFWDLFREKPYSGPITSK